MIQKILIADRPLHMKIIPLFSWGFDTPLRWPGFLKHVQHHQKNHIDVWRFDQPITALPCVCRFVGLERDVSFPSPAPKAKWNI